MHLLFLDIDVVLHARNGRVFERRPLLRDWLRAWRDVMATFSSSRLETSGFERMAAGNLTQTVVHNREDQLGELQKTLNQLSVNRLSIVSAGAPASC